MMHGGSPDAPGELLAAFGHVLSGPVAVISGFAHLLSVRDDEALRREAAEQIGAAATALTEAHENIMTLLALQLGALLGRRETIPIAEVVARASHTSNSHAFADCPIDCVADGAALVESDGWLVRIVGNLLAGLTCDLTGGLACEVRALGQRSTVELRCDIRPGVLQGDRASLALFAGRAALAVYGGSVTVAPGPGGATELVISIRRGGERTQGLRIAVVDDDAAVRRIVGLTVAADSVEVVEAATGGEAIAMLDAPRRPDLIILDWRMPGPGGREVLSHAKAIDPQLPVIVLTSHSESHYREEALALGADAFLKKPFSPLQLLGTLQRLVPDAGL